jgi:putative hydrolase of the HAD superfamily
LFVTREKVLLFDLGGVLVQSEGLVHLGKIAPRDSPQTVADRWRSSRAVDLFERGKITPEEFAVSFIEEWGLPHTHIEFLEMFASWVTGFFPGAESLIETLRIKHRVAYLSNTNAIHYARLPQLSSLFDSGFASHISGHMKPFPEAYAHAISSLEIPPAQICFFDDLAPNVTAAREAGMKAVQVRGLAELKAALKAEGLHGNGDT